jgi:hypothetical protein
MTMLALVVAVALVLIAGLHVYWGIGGVWPGTDEKSCARAIAGFKGVSEMPGPFASFAVAALIAVVALLAMACAGVFASPFAPQSAAGAVLFAALVFLARGGLGFTAFWRRLTPEMPFARLDLRYYSPLCLLLGIALLALAFEGVSA